VLAAILSAVLITAYRFAIADRDKRLLRANFSLYLAPEIVEHMIESARPPALGGEQRTVSVFFSDLKDFTTLSEHLAPTELVAILNAYFSAMEDIVKAHGGLVDKYIGDAIVAVFGSTHTDPDHAQQAVETALACCRRLAEMNADGTSFLGHRLVMRIGLNTGEALVGNIGSKGKFNWTVMGDTVNVASRLQDINKRYGTTILASEATVAAAGAAIAFRHVDRVQVKGRHEAVDVYTPEAAPLLEDPVTAVTPAAEPVARVTASPLPPA